MKSAELAPEATVTLLGVTALELLEVRLTTVPPEGAFPLSVTVPFDELPPTTEAGETVIPVGTAGLTVTITVIATFPDLAVTVTGVAVDTTELAIVNVAVVDPEGTVTL